MEKDNLCVFCGQKPSTFRSTTVQCGNTYQFACKVCERELKDLDDAERCRRALILGLAEFPEKLRERIVLINEAENHRPKCTQCGGKLLFTQVQALDNSPLHDSIFKDPFEVLPAYCEACGKYEFYNPMIAQNNKYLAYLIWKDTEG